MRVISEEFQSHLEGGATTVCRCWELKRKDGVVMGFSDHDKDLSFRGTLFAATSGLDARALQSSNGLSVDNSEAFGALSDAGINSKDILAGKYDAADVTHWIVNWQNPEQRVLVFKGFLGEIRHGANSFEAELRGLSEKLNTNIGRSYLRQCSAQLGDKKCGFNTDDPLISVETKVKRVEKSRVIFTEQLDSFTDDWFAFGRVIWTTGKNLGLSSIVRSDVTINSERRLELTVEPAFFVEAEDQFQLVAGCDKQIGTCRSKFDNVINFQGFPFIPGEDWALAYPVRGEGNDGGSLSPDIE